MCGVVAALFALHSSIEPVIHGDIKAVRDSPTPYRLGQFVWTPSQANVLVGDDGQALLTDFGLSRICGTEGFTTENPMGTCRWMAVELLSAISNDEPIRTTTASDVWAFGMTILEVSRYQFETESQHYS